MGKDSETHNKSLKSVPGLAAVHLAPLSGRRLAHRYEPQGIK
jgi:hypothetical protein